jgi:hypothetical protein
VLALVSVPVLAAGVVSLLELDESSEPQPAAKAARPARMTVSWSQRASFPFIRFTLMCNISLLSRQDRHRSDLVRLP